MGRMKISTATGAALLLALGACAPAATMGTMNDMAPMPGAMPDGQIVAVAMAANSGEVQTSQPMVSRATSPAVQQFAQEMVTDHSAANDKLQALGIAPMQNDLSQQLAANAAQTVQSLSAYSQGAALDRTYMQAQLAMHQYTLNSLDNVLIPSARSDQLRMALQQIRATVADHLQKAQQIAGSM